MSRTLNLTGFQTGDNLNLSVSQGALTAGPVNVPSWGGPTGGGTISINVERTRMQCAPDSVRFTVDLDSADFDTSGPVGEEVYDARMHELIYLWDFDDAASGNWSAPVNVLSAWKNRNVAKGPFVAHMYTLPGTYNPSVIVIEPSSGKMAQAKVSEPVVIVNPDTVYPGTNTVCINPIGDTDFSDAPIGAETINMNSINANAVSTYESLTPRRFLLKRGATFDLNFHTTFYSDIYIGAYGSAPEKPVCNAPLDDHAIFAPGLFGNGSLSDIRIVGLKIFGGFDPTTDVDVTYEDKRYGVGGLSNVEAMVSEVDFDGTFSVVSFSDTNKDRRVHIDDCTATNMGGNYPLFFQPAMGVLTCSSVMTGCRIAQPSGTHETNAEKSAGIHSPVRWNSVPRIHMRGCDFFHADFAHFSLRLNSGSNNDGNIANIHSMSLEGGAGAITFAADPSNPTSGLGRSVVSNAVFDGIIYVGGYSAATFFESYSTGVTVRNCLCIVANTPRMSLIAFRKWVHARSEGTYDPDLVGAAPVKIYNNTFVFLRPSAENNGHLIENIQDDSGGIYTALRFDNNIVHQPDYTPQVVSTYAPLTTTQLPWAPRNTGVRDPGMISLHTAHGTSGTGRILFDSGSFSDFYTADEVLTFSSGATAKVAFDLPSSSSGNINGRLYLYDIVGSISAGDTFSGADGSASVSSEGLNTDQLETEYATPNEDLAYYKPDTGSPAIGAATTGNIAFAELGNLFTQTAISPRDVGAWQNDL